MGYKYVVCPHWVVRDWVDKGLGKNIPYMMSLARSEIAFLASHSSIRAFVSCTNEFYKQLLQHPIPLVQQTDPIGYYLQAHVLFPDCAQYQGPENSLPLRLFHPQKQIFWAFHRLRVCGLIIVDDASTENRVNVTQTGKLTASHMSQMGLTFEWAAFIQYMYNCVYNVDGLGKERVHQGSVQIGLPLALTSTLHMGRLLSRTTKSATIAQMVTELLGIVQDSDMRWRHNVAHGDLWSEAILISLHLHNELSTSHGGWQLELPDAAELKKRCDYATKFYFKFTDEPWTLEALFSGFDHPEMDEDVTFVQLFEISIAASRLFNLARVKYDHRVEDDGSKTQDGQWITGFDIGSNLPVYISKDSVAHCVIDPRDLEEGQAMVCYTALQARKPIPNQVGNGTSYTISGISYVSGEILYEVFHHVFKNHNLQPGDGLMKIIGYPFQ